MVMMVAQRSVMVATWHSLSMACLLGLGAVALQAAELEPELLEVERDEPEQLESAPVLPEKTEEART